MRRTLVLLLISLLALTACGGEESGDPAELTLTPSEATTEPQPETTVEPEATEEARAPQSFAVVDRTTSRRHAPVAQDSVQTPAEICELADAQPLDDTIQFEAAEEVLEDNVDYRAVICTDEGPIYIDLLESFAPLTVNNFVFLAQNNYYDGTIFHRVIDGFMAQGGDPTGTGRGGPGYQFADEFVSFLTFESPGWLAMANANRPDQGIVGTNGSQFFITTVPTPHLDYAHTIFGEVLEGQDVVDAIQIRDPQTGGDATTLQTVVIVTDPSTVETTYVEPEQATSDDVLASLDELGAGLSGTNLTFAVAPAAIPDVVEGVSDDVRSEYEAVLEDNGFDFAAISTLENTECDLQSFPFSSLGYTLLAFDSSEDASEVMDSGVFDDVAESEGFVSIVGQVYTANYFEQSTTACDTEAIAGRHYAQRGRYIAIISATSPVSDRFTTDLVIDQITSRLYESTLANIFQRSLR